MKYPLLVPALLLIAANVAAHVMGGFGPLPGREMPLARLGGHHLAQMAALLMLTLMARGLRDSLYPALTALAALCAGYFIARCDPMRFAPSGFNNFYVPLLWSLTALCVASAASRAAPPPEERPGLTGFKKMVWLLILLNCGLLIFFAYARPLADSTYQSNLLTTAFFIIFPGWLLLASGRWAHLLYIAGLAAAAPALTAALVLAGRFPPDPDRFTEVYAFCEGFQMTYLSLLSGLVCVIGLAVKAGVRLKGRMRRPVRPLARTLSLFPAGGLIMAAMFLAAWPLSQKNLPTAPFKGEMIRLALADLEMMIPAGYEVGPVHYRLPLAGREPGLLMVEKPFASEMELSEELAAVNRRMRRGTGFGHRLTEFSGECRGFFGRPAWLAAASSWDPASGPPESVQRAEFDLTLLHDGGRLRLTAEFEYDPRPGSGRDFDAFLSESLDIFMEAAALINRDYRWIGRSGRVGESAFRTLYGAFDRPPEGLRMTAMAGPATASQQRLRDFSRDTLFIRRGWRAQWSYPVTPVTGLARVDTPIAYYQGFRVNHTRPLALDGLAGLLETRYFSGSPVSLGLSAHSGLGLGWSGQSRDGRPLEIGFASSIVGRDPARGGLAAAALGQWEAVIASLRLAEVSAASRFEP